MMNRTVTRRVGIRILALLLAPLLMVGCDTILTSEHPYGEEFDLQYGKTALIGGEVLVRFIGVVNDSRCPVDVTCVWEGNAEIELEIRRTGGDAKRIRLNTHSSFPQQIVVDGITVRLVGLTPHPDTRVTIDPKEYVARLVVTR